MFRGVSYPNPCNQNPITYLSYDENKVLIFRVREDRTASFEP